MDLNKVMIIGRLSKDVELKMTSGNKQVASFSVATSSTWKDTSGNKQSKTEFHNIIAWGKLAEICGQFLKKGVLVYIEGRIQTRNWQDQNGNNKNKTEIIADNMIMLESKKFDNNNNNNNNNSFYNFVNNNNSNNTEDINDIKIEEIPF
jgi:single-strand DNA-binding protein